SCPRPKSRRPASVGRREGSCRRGRCARVSWFARKFVSSVDEASEDPRLGKCMPGALDQVEFGVRPLFGQLPSIPRRAWHVVAAGDDQAGNTPKLVRVTQKLSFFEPCTVGEEVIFDARDS